MRALAVGVFGLVVGSVAFAEDAPAIVHFFPAPDSNGAVQMARTGANEIWFPQPNANSLARLSNDGSISERHLPAGDRGPLAISRSSFFDSRIVFTQVEGNRIGIFDSGGALTDYDIPTPASNPRGIAGVDTIWFTEYDGNKIGRLEPAAPGGIVEFPIPTFASGPFGITTDWDDRSGTGGAWFTENVGNKIGRINAVGAISEYPIPTPDSGPTAIEAAEDALYFTETRGNRIGRITRSGQITEFPIPTRNSSPVDLALDSEFPGGFWIAQRASRLSWMSLDGDFHEFLIPGTARPESVALDRVGEGFFAPRAVWFLDSTNRRVGRLSENHLFAIGAVHGGTLDTEFEFANASDEVDNVRVGGPSGGVCPGFCPPTFRDLVIPRHGEADTSASQIPNTEGRRLYQVTGILPEMSDVPETRAWVVDDARPNVRIEVPLVDYWTIATAQPPLAPGSSGPQPTLTVPARRSADVRTRLILAAIGGPGRLDLEIQALDPEREVVAEIDYELINDGDAVVLDQVFSDLGIFGDFEGYIRVRRLSRSGLFWAVAEIEEDGVLTRLMPPGSELGPPADCTGGPRRCHPRGSTRVVTRDSP